MTGAEGAQVRWFRHMNLFGWFMAILAFYIFFAFIFKWEPIRTLESQEPSVWRYGLEAVLLMIVVPLAWTAWKRARLTQRAYRMDRWVIGIWFCMLTFYVIESRLVLQGGSRWRPHAPLMLIWTAVFAAKAFGMKRVAPAPEDSASNSSEKRSFGQG